MFVNDEGKRVVKRLSDMSYVGEYGLDDVSETAKSRLNERNVRLVG